MVILATSKFAADLQPRKPVSLGIFLNLFIHFGMRMIRRLTKPSEEAMPETTLRAHKAAKSALKSQTLLKECTTHKI